MKKFMSSLEKELDNNYNNISVTENGAIGYRTTGKILVDLNYKVSTMRNKDAGYITSEFMRAYNESPILAIKWLFMARDVRGGMGERRLFRVCLKHLAGVQTDIVKAVLPLLSEYGRYDDMLCLLDTGLYEDVVRLVSEQLETDLRHYLIGQPVSLLAKWLPSINASSRETKRLGTKLARGLGLTDKEYRKALKHLRAYIDVVEVKMTANQWDKIEYSSVPSRANLIYSNAFYWHDMNRRVEYLENVRRGVEKIHAGVLYPHEIVHRYMSDNGNYLYSTSEVNPTYEELWKGLPDYVQGAGNTLCVVDGSGSMHTCISGTDIEASDVARGLGLYFAEHCTGEFKDKYIEFNDNPRIIDFSMEDSLLDRLREAQKYNAVGSTDIEKVFDLILDTAVSNNMSQADLPSNILILSDMEFNIGVMHPKTRLFEQIADKYKQAGYKLPRLVYWNILSRTGTIPLKENEMGVALVSGFSPSIMQMVLSTELDPYKCLLDLLNSERYTAVEKSISKVLG